MPVRLWRFGGMRWLLAVVVSEPRAYSVAIIVRSSPLCPSMLESAKTPSSPVVKTPSSPVVLHTPGPWRRAVFTRRPNRFVIHARLVPGGPEVRAHLPDPGRLAELLVPGRTIWLKAADRPRKTAWTAVYVEPAEGGLACCDTSRPNQLAALALRSGAIGELSEWRFLRSEAAWGSSRFDFLLGRGDRRLYLEAKGVSWVVEGVARFPDAVTARGARHLRELAQVAATPGHAAAVLFIVQRSEPVRRIEAAADRDPEFATALGEAHDAGVQLLGRRTRMTLDATELGPPVQVAGWR